ncbi:zinc metallopeptidase [Aspergillus nomiae NRRL 13137]|uniref:Zinc metallopeptidase n=1 Tax=Aspergillus nomiae NRRL (strain ATCC 15546 / NRRL 13137 / CBS 260.88 / M93) TaxID=1509407 RepID=A0A0L1IZ29_ASPN3|nr:zinc metallopeptidase [Aspergillus nomiae NRRL 13137]KNG84660.1 zinc metallopeptidase [Aspergillus nomiae NRRL 13137]
MSPPQLSPEIQTISNVRLYSHSSNPTTYDLTVSSEHSLSSIVPHSQSNASPNTSYPPLALPALTHPHIHLDKAYILNSTTIHPQTGSFQEALSLTTQAKSTFTEPDLHRRGEWLLSESLLNGVTALRAFIEIDTTVQHKCLTTGIQLKHSWRNHCHIQLVAFAQDPLFSGPHAQANRDLMHCALTDHGAHLDVIGVTPYVEADLETAKQSIKWAITTAWQTHKHVDFHLDYHLDPTKGALVWFVLQCLRDVGWTKSRSNKRVMLGHCTRFTLFRDDEWERLTTEIGTGDHALPVSLVGLPTSDLYMASPPLSSSCCVSPPSSPISGSCSSGSCCTSKHGDTVRGTLRVPELIRRYGLDVVLGVNNVGNAFTPWGSVDPLGLACLAVGMYQAGTVEDAEILYECVSTRARAAMGLDEDTTGLCIRRPDLLLFFDVDESGGGVVRPRRSVAEVVWDPPARMARAVVSGGKLVRTRGRLWDESAFGFV